MDYAVKLRYGLATIIATYPTLHNHLRDLTLSLIFTRQKKEDALVVVVI
jgi:hypothetical protein